MANFIQALNNSRTADHHLDDVMLGDIPLPLDAYCVTKRFHKNVVLRDVSVQVQPGRIHALLGPNGAGKTTLAKICAGLLLPDEGSVRIGGFDLKHDERKARSRLGLVLGGSTGFYGRATARDNLLFFADILGVPSRVRVQRVDEALERVGLTGVSTQREREFSRGMSQRLHLARGILAQPPLLLLDEVTSGLDPDVSVEVRALVRDLANQGTGILFTSHLLGEVEQLADEVSLLVAGAVERHGTVADLVNASGVREVSTFSLPVVPDELREAVQRLPGALLDVEAREGREIASIVWRTPADIPALQRTVEEITSRPLPNDFVTRGATLEEAYLALIRMDSRA